MVSQRIRYSSETIKNMQKIVYENSNTIMECLKVIEKKAYNIPNILSTPKFNKALPVFEEYIKKQEQFMDEKQDAFNNIFSKIISSYLAFEMDVKKTLGGNNND